MYNYAGIKVSKIKFDVMVNYLSLVFFGGAQYFDDIFYIALYQFKM